MISDREHLSGLKRHYDVVIVGAGPVGLAAAIELGSRNVRCLLVEQNDRVGYAPRAKTTNVRTRTHLRRWGIAERLAERAPLGLEYPSNVIFTTRLAGTKLAQFDDAFNAAPSRSPFYPEHAQWIPQYKLEQVLREHVETLSSVDLRFNTRFTGLEQDENGVQARLELNDGRTFGATAAYLIGADGARSEVRSALGIEMSGRYGLSRNFNIVFRAPGLKEAHALGPAIMYWQINGEVPSLIGPMDREDIWFFMPTGVNDEVGLSDDEARQLIAKATGIDLPYEILSSDFWVASRLIADSYASGRVFLAGDACHLHPPFGGYGMNMGVSDAVDLGWKIAAIMQGWAGEALLDSYEIERRPVHKQIMDEAEANHALLGNQLWREGIEDAGALGIGLRDEIGRAIQTHKAREFRTLGAVLGYRYCGSPAIIGAPDECALDAQNYEPSSEPGCLAPHIWFGDASLYDDLGKGFTLLVHGDQNVSAAIEEAGARAIPLAVVPLPASARHLYPKDLTLVRPDQHVCWRGASWVSGIFDRVTGLINQQVDAGELAHNNPGGEQTCIL